VKEEREEGKKEGKDMDKEGKQEESIREEEVDEFNWINIEA